jgi:hypothetical protein
MATCIVCRKRSLLRPLCRRLAIPEYRAVTGFWPWLQVRVCPDCVAAYDRDFLERLRLLAPQVLENDEPVSARVCLACGRTGVRGPWPERGSGPAGTEGFRGNLSADEAALEADDFWSAPPETLDARAAWLGPVRKDYGLRYRLDMVCDRRGGRRDGLVIVRTGPDRLAAYRYSTCLPKEATFGAASRS